MKQYHISSLYFSKDIYIKYLNQDIFMHFVK